MKVSDLCSRDVAVIETGASLRRLPVVRQGVEREGAERRPINVA